MRESIKKWVDEHSWDLWVATPCILTVLVILAHFGFLYMVSLGVYRYAPLWFIGVIWGAWFFCNIVIAKEHRE